MLCKDGKCDISKRIAAARAGRAGVGAVTPLGQSALPTAALPSAQGSGIGIGVLALVALVVIVMRK